MSRLNLPIDSHLGSIRDHLLKAPNLIIKASPGSGKTTRVPPALMNDPAITRDRSEIIVLEPRRLAAKLAAQRVAFEEGVRIGEEVGYHFRFENRTGPKTRLRFYTEGMLLRRLISDPELRKTAVVILDEFHERHLQSDIALSYLRWLQLERGSPLKIVVMSATLDTDALSRYLGNAPLVEIKVQLHPVEQNYLPTPPTKRLEQLVKEAVGTALSSNSGDILVFLPGKSEIYRCEQALEEYSKRAEILPLHGDLNSDEQDRAVQTGNAGDRPKVILATNIAETSLTLPGVRTVIDSGLHRVASYSWWSGVPTLRTRPVSKASAIQRAGRAGRTGPGTCLRLYPRGDFDTRAAFDVAEIHRADLAQSLLELKALGVSDLKRFPWFDPPPVTSIEASELLLYRLGALSSDGKLTTIGEKLKQSSAHPRISRMLMEAAKFGVLEEASRLAALIQEGELDAQYETTRLSDRARRSQNLLKDAFPSDKKNSNPSALGISLLCGFPDRVIQRKGSSSDLLLFAGGSAVAASPEKLGKSEYFIALEVFEQQGLQRPGQAPLKAKTKIEALFAIEPEWLFELEPSALEEKKQASWDPARKRAVLRESLTYGALVLSEKLKDAESSPETAALLAKTAWGLDLREVSLETFLKCVGKTPEQEGILNAALGRVELYLKNESGETGYFTSQTLTAWMNRVLDGKLSLQQLESIDWEQELLDFLEQDRPGISYPLQSGYPTQFAFPNGRKTKIHYSLTQPPWMESRLQDFFGVKKSPTVGNGKTPIILHLLAPNYRAVQVTTDLSGFWQKAYPELRKQLSRRYPRHSWPEDPGKA